MLPPSYSKLFTIFLRSGFDTFPLVVFGHSSGAFPSPNQKKYLGALNLANFSLTNALNSSSLGCLQPSRSSTNAKAAIISTLVNATSSSRPWGG